MDPRPGRRVRGGQGKFLAEVRADLIRYAEAVFRLNERQADGKTLGEHLEIAAQHDASAREQLDIEPLADAALHVWEWFGELSARRGSNGFGPNPLSFRDLEDWERRRGVRLAPHEEDWIFELDRIFLAALAGTPAAKKG